MRVLSIGNSFSQDAHRWLHDLAKANGKDIYAANLYIGGCSLFQHWANVEQDAESYDYEINGQAPLKRISVKSALADGKWDVVTIQQASPFSGMEETYYPFADKLVDLIKQMQPDAEIYFHQTWSYEMDSDLGAFAEYHFDRREMFDRIKAASENAAKRLGIKLIPVGTVIQYLRENEPVFDYKNGGFSLNRDGFHLTFDFGRYTAAAVWFCTLTGEQIASVEIENFDIDILEKIVCAVHKNLF